MHPDQAEIKRRLKAIRRAHGEAKREVDRSARSATTIRATRTHSVFVAPPRVLPVAEATIASELTPRELQNPDICYICKSEFTTLHHFYDSLCPSCAEFNYEKRFQTCSLQGRVALITGARLKIGYHAALMMLRAGATVIVTTRFPKDAALRYAKEPDFQEWKTRLKVYGLDLRHSPSVEAFTRYIEATNHRLDFLINNAAQTVRRPPGFYAHLLKVEDQPLHEFSADVQMILQGYEECKASLVSGGLDSAAQAGTAWVAEWHKGKALGLASSAHLSQIPYACDDAANLDPKFFPMGKLDADLQQVDLRQMNSWRMTLGDVPTAELLEVQLINSIAPFILCSKLKPLMLRDETGDKHIVNVSAMEGKFSRHTKTDKHPHTNMAKAALNMMTLTSARDYAEEGIYMNAVDTGWVTDEDPAEIVIRKQKEHDFQPPLDIVDGAARVMDPIFSGLITGQHNWGNFLKDYMPTEW
jgi:NAD(P)-dependent dehydrogenase (short-subunit alcohol dehydrogenase family)